MKILVLGASQGTGALTVRSALARGHHVTAFARSPQKLVLEHERLTRRVGDFHDPASVDAAVAGHDAVIVTASAPSLKAFKQRPDYFSSGTANAIAAMKAHGVRRLVVLSALGTGDSLPLVNVLVRKLLVGVILRIPFEDHVRQEQLTRDSGLDWVIARPSALTNGPARGRYVKTSAIEPVPAFMSRADVAEFLVEAADSAAWVGKAVNLGG